MAYSLSEETIEFITIDMKLKTPQISIFVNADETTIEITDAEANVRFITVTLTARQFSQCLSRLSNVECNVLVQGLDKLNKKMLNKKHEFEIPDDVSRHENEDKLSEIIKKTLPEGWIPDNYYRSQDSFFSKDGKKYARTIIRTWV